MTRRLRPDARLSLAARRRCAWQHRVYSPAWWRGRTYGGVSPYMVAEYTLCVIIFDPDYMLFSADGAWNSYGTPYLYTAADFDNWTDGATELTHKHVTRADEMLAVMWDSDWWAQRVLGEVLGAIEPYHNTTRGMDYLHDDQGLWRFV